MAHFDFSLALLMGHSLSFVFHPQQDSFPPFSRPRNDSDMRPPLVVVLYDILLPYSGTFIRLASAENGRLVS